MDHLEHAKLATATLMDISSRAQAMQAAILRNAAQEEVEIMRAQAHDVFDAYLDHSASAALAAKSILG